MRLILRNTKLNSAFITSDFVKLNNVQVDAIRHHMTSIQDRIKVLNEQVRQFGSRPISNCKIHNPINFANAEAANHVNVVVVVSLMEGGSRGAASVLMEHP
ncbi:hypothetical protein CEXT_400741 [Caerostris extrusa]|uniref:Uncharacterized protein n=1 Tax=Caerostris extrusa TaxID=172846 RepID=A0AAV4WEU8_CAEEX|nr:hypothetical protein CEXT_400741 [Caerostris extrusa]